MQFKQKNKKKMGIMYKNIVVTVSTNLTTTY